MSNNRKRWIIIFVGLFLSWIFSRWAGLSDEDFYGGLSTEIAGAVLMAEILWYLQETFTSKKDPLVGEVAQLKNEITDLKLVIQNLQTPDRRMERMSGASEIQIL